MRNSSPILENFIQENYNGTSLPPLWQVIYQEAVRGHHLLFRRVDSERYDLAAETLELWTEHTFTEELEVVVMRLLNCSDLQAMIRIIDALPDSPRKNLYVMYRRVLWMWRNYVKEQMN